MSFKVEDLEYTEEVGQKDAEGGLNILRNDPQKPSMWEMWRTN